MLNEGGKLLGRSAPIRSILADLERLLPSLTPGRRAPSILLQGETGTGKGLLARTLHEASPRAGRPFVDLNCAAIPATLLEAELFGFERGAFTDARQARPGLIQAAHTGTLFLDEIGLLPVSLQTKLLTVLDTREVRPLGRTRAQAVDVLIVAATNSDLRVAVREGQFREDLYHRLAVLVFSLPPLRDRGEDILELADAFLVRACADHGLASKTLSAAALAALGAHAWPGNVRELANLMDRVALLSPRSTITADDLGLPGAAVVDRTSASEPDRDRPFKESVEGFTRARLEEALSQARGNVSAAADQLGVPRSTLRYQLERLGLAPGRTRGSRQPTSPRARVSSITETPALPDEAPGRKPLGERILTSGATLDPERKHVTVLFAGLTGSPELFADSGGDERHRLVDPAFEQMLEGVRRYDGTVDAVRDDGIVALFGAPLAREDHALRGCDAAFAIREAVERHAEELRHAHGLDLQVRIGLHSGDVVVRSVGDERRLDYVAAPETMNLAARLEQLAGAGTTLVTASTLRLAEGFVEVVPRGFVPVPGVARPLDVYE